MDIENLVKEAQAGDDEAFYSLIFNEKDSLYSTAFSFFRDEQEALEAIQEITCRAYVKIKKLKEPGYFSTWLTRIMINYCIDELKKRKKLVSIEELRELHNDGQHKDLEPQQKEENTVDNIVVSDAMERLEPKYKKVIAMRYYEDMTVPHIAKEMNKPEGTIKTWLSRGLKQLRDLLSIGGE